MDKDTRKLTIEVSFEEMAYISMALDLFVDSSRRKNEWLPERIVAYRKKWDDIYRSGHSLLMHGVKGINT